MTTPVLICFILLAVLCFAAFSKRLQMSVITMPIFFTGLGYLVHLSGLADFGMDAEYNTLHVLAEITLVMVLFSDASGVRLASLRASVGLPVRLLLIGMPLTILFGMVVARLVSPEQSWALALLVAAILAPTDAALGMTVVTDKKVPEDLREAVSVESGLNDGLSLPVVIIAALAAVEASGGGVGGGTEGPSSLLRFGLMQVTLGPLAGIVVGFASAKLLDFAVERKLATESYQGIYFLAAAFLCFVGAELIGGNGLIAAFIGGLTFGNARNCRSEFVAEFMESEGQLLTMATFLTFGAVLAPAGLTHITWTTVLLALAFLTFVRIIPVVLSLSGTSLPMRDKLFLGWFGPRGLASILFVLLVVEEYDLPNSEEVLACVVLTVLISIVIHGASAFPIVRAFGKRSGK